MQTLLTKRFKPKVGTAHTHGIWQVAYRADPPGVGRKDTPHSKRPKLGSKIFVGKNILWMENGRPTGCVSGVKNLCTQFLVGKTCPHFVVGKRAHILQWGNAHTFFRVRQIWNRVEGDSASREARGRTTETSRQATNIQGAKILTFV